jgi:hypothetical protein
LCGQTARHHSQQETDERQPEACDVGLKTCDRRLTCDSRLSTCDFQLHGYRRHSSIRLATSPVHPVW